MRSLLVVPLVLLVASTSSVVVEGRVRADHAQQELNAEAEAQKSERLSKGEKDASSSHKKMQEKLMKKLGEKIKHIVVLMEENRSYDHLMGWYPKGNGLTGQEFNYENPLNKSSPKYFVQKGAKYVNPGDPDHSVNGTAKKLWGPKAWAEQNFTTTPTGEGFIWDEATIPHNSGDGNNYPFAGVLEMFDTKEQLPVFSALAENYLSFDRFFAGMPGPTWPNRQFFLSATSAGLTETFFWYNMTPGLLYPQKTVFDQVGEANATWKVYYEDTPWELFMETLAHSPEHLHSMDQFFADCQSGDLPHFSYLNPRSGINITTGVGSNDEHPDHDVALAEAHYKRVYEAIRASPVWNETLFIITYDEHGGFYDHVPTPLNVPPPAPGMASYSYPDKFSFDRLGVRMPTLLISPWVEKGAIVGAPPSSQKPFPDSEYDTTSILASVRKIIKEMQGLPPLTGRDAWVATWEHVFENVTTPRTDCPMTLPAAPAPTLAAEDEAAQVVNFLQRTIMTFHANLHGKGTEAFDHIKTQGQVSQWLQDTYNAHKHKTLAWKASKRHAKPRLGLETLQGFTQPIEGQQWLLNRMPNMTGTGKMTFSMKWVNASAANATTLLCLDGAGMRAGSNLTISHCYPSPDPAVNRDADQWWTLHKDATIRPFADASLCVTNRLFASNQTDVTLFLRPCVEGDVTQHYAYHGHDGNGYPGQILFGDGSYFFTIYTEAKPGPT